MMRFSISFSIGLICLHCALATANAQVVLYDNTERSAKANEQFVHPSEAWFFAQSFLTDQKRTTVSRVNIPTGKFGAPSGELRLSIWDDAGGLPGRFVGEIGEIGDVASLEPTSFGGSLEGLTFDGLTVSLLPNSTYYLVLDLTDTNSSPFIPGGCGPCDGVMNGFLQSSQGTNDTSSLLVRENNAKWFNLRERTGRESWLQMSIAARFDVLGDFDEDGLLTAIDIDLLSAEVRVLGDDLTYDANADGIVDIDDHRHWVMSPQYANTFVGDTNLDGTVDFPDFLALSAGFGQSGGWGQGDFNGDGQIEFPDFLALSANFGQSATATAPVPEPSSMFLLLFGLVAIGRSRR